MEDKSLLIGTLSILILISCAAYAGPKKRSTADMMTTCIEHVKVQPTCALCTQLCENHDGALCDGVALRALLQEILAQEHIEFKRADIKMAPTINNYGDSNE